MRLNERPFGPVPPVPPVPRAAAVPPPVGRRRSRPCRHLRCRRRRRPRRCPWHRRCRRRRRRGASWWWWCPVPTVELPAGGVQSEPARCAGPACGTARRRPRPAGSCRVGLGGLGPPSTIGPSCRRPRRWQLVALEVGGGRGGPRTTGAARRPSLASRAPLDGRRPAGRGAATVIWPRGSAHVAGAPEELVMAHVDLVRRCTPLRRHRDSAARGEELVPGCRVLLEERRGWSAASRPAPGQPGARPRRAW